MNALRVLTICALLCGLCDAQSPSNPEDQTSKVCSKIQAEKNPKKANKAQIPSGGCKGNRHSVKLSWNASDSLSVPLDTDEGYDVYRWKIDGSCINIEKHIESTKYEDCSVEQGKTYRYAVTAVKQKRESDPSNIVEASIPQP